MPPKKSTCEVVAQRAPTQCHRPELNVAETANRLAAARRVAARQGESRLAKTEYRFLESG